MTEKLKENYLRQQQVLAGVLEKAPEQAREGILKAIEDSAFGLENVIENIRLLFGFAKNFFRRRRAIGD